MRAAARWLAWTLGSLAVLLSGVGVPTWIFVPGSLGPEGPPVPVVLLGLLPALWAFPLVGMLVATRLPRHPVGWLFITGGLAMGTATSAFGYAYASTARPGAALILWLGGRAFMVGIAAGLVALVLFPTGRLPSSRWRLAPWLLILGFALLDVSEALMPGQLNPGVPLQNPFGIEGAESSSRPGWQWATGSLW